VIGQLAEKKAQEPNSSEDSPKEGAGQKENEGPKEEDKPSG
jgi:hypothetical protein